MGGGGGGGEAGEVQKILARQLTLRNIHARA